MTKIHINSNQSATAKPIDGMVYSTRGNANPSWPVRNESPISTDSGYPLDDDYQQHNKPQEQSSNQHSEPQAPRLSITQYSQFSIPEQDVFAAPSMRSAQKMSNLHSQLSKLKSNSHQTHVQHSSEELNQQQYSSPKAYEGAASPHSDNQWPSKLYSKKKKGNFHWMDYSLSFVLLVVSVALGFNLAFAQNSGPETAQAAPEIAGVTDDSPAANTDGQISPEESITKEEFEAWMNEHYPEESAIESVPPSPVQDLSLMQLFGAEDLGQINNLDVDKNLLDNQINSAQRKNDYIALSKKIDSYMATYRSFEPYDNQLSLPLTGMTYIAVSEQTGMPLKYLMAISRAESRFGSDRFLSSGNLTRPGQYLNPCSIGLDDEGGNIGFASWEEGLLACGEWYQYFESRGVPDCRKWGIFNPNGDYCSKIETLASEIDYYLKN